MEDLPVLSKTIADRASSTFANELLSPENVEGLKTQYNSLNRMVGGIRPKHTYILVASQGVGKSLFGLNLVVKLADDGTKVCYIDLENGSFDSIRRIVQIRYQLNSDSLLKLESEQMVEMLSRLENITYYDHDQYPPEDRLKVTIDIINREAKKGVKVFLLDPLQAFVSIEDSNEWYAQGEIVRELKELAQTLSVSIIILHHLRKGQPRNQYVETIEDTEGVNYILPNLESIKGSSKIADYATDVWGMLRTYADLRKEGRGKTLLRILKQRTGQTGDIRLVFDEDTLTFRDPGVFESGDLKEL